MSVGRFILRGWAFQSRVYAPWALGNSGAVVTVAEQTRRHRLIGTAATRAALTSTSADEVRLIGTTGQRHSLTGATR
jgi:hypothetical protein